MHRTGRRISQGLRLAVAACLVLGGCVSLPLHRSGSFEFGLMGDVPYDAEEERKMPALMEDINRRDLAFVVQNGDFQIDPRGYRNGIFPCTDEALLDRVRIFETSRHPFVVTPGDNDWADCLEAKPSIDPLQRLARLREVIYRDDRSLGQRRMTLIQQSDDAKYAAFRENARWSVGDVAFATIHIIGSNNNFNRTAATHAEYLERNAASIEWMKVVFDKANLEGKRAVMLIIQANPRFEDRWPKGFFGRMRTTPPAAPQTGFTEFLIALEREVLDYGKPVVLVHGDTHYFRIDKPLIGTKSGKAIEHFTRVENFSTPDVHWLRVTVDPNDPQVFTFRQEIVQRNLINHGRP